MQTQPHAVPDSAALNAILIAQGGLESDTHWSGAFRSPPEAESDYPDWGGGDFASPTGLLERLVDPKIAAQPTAGAAHIHDEKSVWDRDLPTDSGHGTGQRFRRKH